MKLCDAGYDGSLETSGALDIGAVDARVSRVVDLKTPDSNECERNRYDGGQSFGDGGDAIPVFPGAE